MVCHCGADKAHYQQEQGVFKANRKVDDSGGEQAYKAVDKLRWSPTELQEGKLVKLHKFPLDVKVKLFRVAVSTDRTDWLVTNDLSQASTEAAQQESSNRWKIDRTADAATAPGRETSDRNCQMPVSAESESAKSYCSGSISLVTTSGVSLSMSDDGLSTQAWLTHRLS